MQRLAKAKAVTILERIGIQARSRELYDHVFEAGAAGKVRAWLPKYNRFHWMEHVRQEPPPI